jgi:ParB-like chromosome segregation protein Spo0J
MTADPGLTITMAKRIELWPVDRLRPYERNARTHSTEQVTQIAASIVEFGFTNPILVDSSDGIVAGHGRLTAAQELGLRTVPVVVLDHLSERQRKAYILADNQLALNAGWDTDLLRGELQDLAEQDFDLSLIGFSDDELADLLPDIEELPPEDADADAVPEPPADPVSKPGDVWLLGKHRVMCGDSSDPLSIDTLLQNKMPDAVITDPPYGIGIDGQKESKSKNPKHNRKAHDFRGWDSERPDEGIFNYIAGLQCPAVIWGGNYFADLLPATRGWIYWSKGQDGLSMSDGELAWTTESKPLRCVTVNRAALQGSVHPTQKPLQVIEFSLDYITAGTVVLDLFGGSGSTLIACEKTSRLARLMELDPRYCDVIVKRWQQFTGKTATLEATGERFPEDAA